MASIRFRSCVFVVLGFSAALAACSAGTEPFAAPPDEQYPQSVVDAGEQVFLRTCATCHGRQGGGGVGPNIRQVWERLSYDEHLAVATNGRNTMPAFGSSLDAEDLAAVVAYQRVGWDDPPG